MIIDFEEKFHGCNLPFKKAASNTIGRLVCLRNFLVWYTLNYSLIKKLMFINRL